MKHWAYDLIGQPWTPEDNCWALVRRVFKEQHRIEIPLVRVSQFGDIDNVAAIKLTATTIGFRPAEGDPMVDDIVLMRGPLHERHVGVMIDSKRGPLLLHSSGFMTDTGPRGAVTADAIPEVRQAGYRDFECWRKAA